MSTSNTHAVAECRSGLNLEPAAVGRPRFFRSRFSMRTLTRLGGHTSAQPAQP